MRKELNFNKFVYALLATLFVFIFVLGILNNNSNPVVKEVKVIGDKNAVEFENQQIQFIFNRPLRDLPVEDLNKYVEFSSEEQYTVSLNKSSLFISFTENLSSNKSYKVNIIKGIEDIFGRSLEQNFSYEFKTTPQRFTYLSKNSDQDQIVISNVLDEYRETVFQTNEIIDYDTNQNFLVVAHTDSLNILNTKISVINLNKFLQRNEGANPLLSTLGLYSYTDWEITLENQKINELSISPTLNEFTGLLQDVSIEQDIVIPTSANKVGRFKILEESFEVLESDESLKEVISIDYSRDGRYLLYRSTLSNFYLLDLKDVTQIIRLGQFQYFGDMNSDQSKFLFSNFDLGDPNKFNPFLVEYQLDRSTKIISEEGEYILDPKFFRNSDKYLYSRKYDDVINGQGLFELVLRNEDQNEISNFKVEGYSYELPRISTEDKFVSAEKYSEQQTLDFTNIRNLAVQTKPGNGNIVIYDIEKNEKILEIENAIELRWI